MLFLRKASMFTIGDSNDTATSSEHFSEFSIFDRQCFKLVSCCQTHGDLSQADERFLSQNAGTVSDDGAITLSLSLCQRRQTDDLSISAFSSKQVLHNR